MFESWIELYFGTFSLSFRYKKSAFISKNWGKFRLILGDLVAHIFGNNIIIFKTIANEVLPNFTHRQKAGILL
jgi:hypothetical protein